jgi:hypothetical protein
MSAKDYWGSPLNVGDTVVFILCNYRELATGKITSIAPKSAEIEYLHPIYGFNQVTRREHWVIIKKPDQPNDSQETLDKP